MPKHGPKGVFSSFQLLLDFLHLPCHYQNSYCSLSISLPALLLLVTSPLVSSPVAQCPVMSFHSGEREAERGVSLGRKPSTGIALWKRFLCSSPALFTVRRGCLNVCFPAGLASSSTADGSTKLLPQLLHPAFDMSEPIPNGRTHVHAILGSRIKEEFVLLQLFSFPGLNLRPFGKLNNWTSTNSLLPILLSSRACAFVQSSPG